MRIGTSVKCAIYKNAILLLGVNYLWQTPSLKMCFDQDFRVHVISLVFEQTPMEDFSGCISLGVYGGRAAYNHEELVHCVC